MTTETNTASPRAAIKLPKYVRIVRNRHGNERLVFQRRRGSPKRNMVLVIGTGDFANPDVHSAPDNRERHIGVKRRAS